MNIAEFRRLALALPGATESEHMSHPDFRAGGRIFATLGAPTREWGVVKLTPEQQQAFIKLDGQSFQPCNGAWGQRGHTMVQLATVDASLVESAIALAHESVTTGAAKKPAKRKSKSRKKADE